MNGSQQDHIKWFSIGFLSALATVALAVVLLIYFTTPLVKIDESSGRVQLLGGLIDLQAKDVITQLSKQGSFVFGRIEGVSTLTPTAEEIAIKFGAGDIRVDFNDTQEMNWDCDGAGKEARLETLNDGKLISLDFSAAFVDCDISVPVRRVAITGLSGGVEVRKIKGDLNIKLTTGDVYLNPLPDLTYAYELTAPSGEVDEVFQSPDAQTTPSQDPKALKIKVDVKIGNISELD